MICDSWECVSGWFGGAGGAAWIQALLTAIVFLYSVRSTKRTFKEDQKRTRSVFEHERNLGREKAQDELLKIELSKFEAYEGTLQRVTGGISLAKMAMEAVYDSGTKGKIKSDRTRQFLFDSLSGHHELLRNTLGEKLPTHQTFHRTQLVMISIHSVMAGLDSDVEQIDSTYLGLVRRCVDSVEQPLKQSERLLRVVAAGARFRRIQLVHADSPVASPANLMACSLRMQGMPRR